MKSRLVILRRAKKQLQSIASPHYERIRDAIFDLALEPRPQGCSKLRGRQGWRIRVGSYRIIYNIDDSEGIVRIVEIGHRKDIYR